ncbi:hypothetical protein [Candidatus Clostridium radicumherbarum]|uniref:Uncharacterized protein n=1 Tax=Candidatus Clostridium radicumherbarum TaxID=3381662 RepID=A0ABW8TNF4_9CLOT
MPDGNSLAAHLARHIGQTVTIFTTSGGDSGEGFTGVLISVNRCFVRLISAIGSAPGCALGNCCTDERRRETMRRNTEECADFELGEMNTERNRNTGRVRNTDRRRITDRFDCTGRNLGAVVDIPIDRIAAFVHNSVGSGGL